MKFSLLSAQVTELPVELREPARVPEYKKICGSALDIQESFRPTQATARDGGGLLDETHFPITVVGTSMSELYGTHALADRLMRASNVNVLDGAISAGGMVSSFLSYVIGQDYAREKPKFLIWEHEADSTNLAKETDLRQLIPAVKGECASPVVSSSFAFNGSADVPVLQVEGQQRLTGHDTFLYFSQDDKTLKKLTIRFEYTDGKSEQVNLERSLRVNDNGRYFLELSGQYKGDLKNVYIMPGQPSQGKGTAKLCVSPG